MGKIEQVAIYREEERKFRALKRELEDLLDPSENGSVAGFGWLFTRQDA